MPIPANSQSLQDSDVQMYRLALFVASIATPLSGLIYKTGNPYVSDAWSIRFVLGGICGFIILLSYTHAAVKKNIDLYFYSLLYIFSSWTIYLFYINHFSSIYAIGFFTSIIFSTFINYRHFFYLLVYLYFSLILIIITSLMVVTPMTSPPVIIGMYILLACMISILVWSKLNVKSKLEASEKTLFTIFNESADAIYLVEPKTLAIHDMNEQGVKLSGIFSKKDAVGISIKQLFSPVDPYLLDTWIPSDLGTQGMWDGQQFLKSKNGKSLWIDIAMRPIIISGRTMISVRLSDVTRIKTAEEELAAKANQSQWINEELTRVNQQMANRETRMIELMQEVETLRKKEKTS